MESSLRLDDLPGAVIAYDPSGVVVQANPAAHDLFGVGPLMLVGSRAQDAGWFLTDAAGWPDPVNLHPALAAIRTGQPQRAVVARVNRPDGTEVWIQVDVVPVAAAAGTITHVVATLTDVTRLLNDVRLPRPGYGAQAVAQVTDELARSHLDPEAILQAVTSTLSKLRAGTWVAALINKDPRTVRVVAANDADPQTAEYIESIQLRSNAPAFPISSRVIESGEPVLMPNVPYGEFIGMLETDVREYLEKNAPPVTSPPIRFIGVLVAPMRARGAVVGTLGLFERPGSNPLTERDVRWVQEVADRTGVAVDNAQLYVDAVNRLERLTALRSVGLAISGSPDLRLTLQVILDQTVAGLGVDAADILLVDQADGMLELMASTGFQSTSIPDFRLSVDDEYPRRIMFGRRIETVTALGGFAQFRRRSLFAREGFKSYGAIPLIVRGKLAGVLEVFHRTTLQPDQEWLEFLDALGSDAAIAIERGRPRPADQDGERHPKTPMPNLSRLETEILGYVVEGLPNRVIAEKVHLSTHTIKFHVGQMLGKVGVSNRTELARKATQEGWL